MSTLTLAAHEDFAVVSTNGNHSVVLYDPTKIKGHVVLVKHGTAQAGTSTVTSAGAGAATALDGGPSDAIIGVNSFKGWRSDGVMWRKIGNSDTSTGDVPSTRTLTGSGAVKVAGDNAAHDLSADRVISFSGTDVSAAGVVTQLTGTAGVVAAPAATLITWAASGPTFGERSATTDAMIRVNTPNSNITLFDGANLIGFFQYNSGSPYFQQVSGAGFQLISTNGTLKLQSATAATAIDFVPGGSTVKGHLTSAGFRLGDGSSPDEMFDLVGRAKIRGASGTAFAVLRDYTATDTYGALYMGGVTPANGNYTLISDGSSLVINSPNAGSPIYLRNGDTAAGNLTSTGLRLGDNTGAAERLDVGGRISMSLSTAPATPVACGKLYLDASGNLHFIGAQGTDTLIGSI